MKARTLLLGVLLTLGASTTVAEHLTKDLAKDLTKELTLGDGVYSDKQLESGERLYKQHCLACHDKKYFGPVFKAWQGQTLDVLFLTMATTMPEANPGMLYDEEYADVLAYILALNRYPSGTGPLTGDTSRLAAVRIAP